MIRFGIHGIYDRKLSALGKLGFFIHGTPHIAKFLQGHYFKKNMREIISRQTSYVIDIGCGPGDFSFFLAEKYPWLNIDSLDCNTDSIKDALERKTKYDEKICFITSDFQAYNIKKKYDVALCIEVLHTVKDKFSFLEKISQAVKEEGFFYFKDRMNGCYSKNIFLRNFKPDNLYQSKYFKGEQLDDGEIFKILKELNFEIVLSRKIIGFFGYVAWEIDQVLQSSKINYLKVSCIPLLKLLCQLDFLFSIGQKNELLIIAKKSKKNE